jgi:two-component system, NarL family, response regulator LiaR
MLEITKKISILLAEDHKLVRQGIRQFLEHEPDFLVAGEARDGEEAVKLARELNPDIIIMDISMPVINGIEATKQIKKAQPKTVVLILSAYDYEEYIFPILEAGAAGYLLKDMSGAELVDAVRTVAKGDSVLHPAIARKLVRHFRSSEGPVEQAKKPETPLTERELQVLRMAAQGMSNKEISSELSLSIHTTESHFGNIFSKIGVYSRIEAVLEALRRGWLTLADTSQPNNPHEK